MDAEEAKLLVDKLFENENLSEIEEEGLLWILSTLIQCTVGGWNPLGKLSEREKGKRSFTKNVSASDIGFCYYLLKYYGKSAMQFKNNNSKERKNRWSKESQESSLVFDAEERGE